MKVNVVYFVNVIDEHLAKVCEEDWTFEDRDLDEVRRYGDFQSDVPQTANRLRPDRYFDAAEIYEDEFAKATREDRHFQYFLEGAVELRDCIAHNLFYEGRLEHDGEFIELPIHSVHKRAEVKIETADAIPLIPQNGCVCIIANHCVISINLLTICTCKF